MPHRNGPPPSQAPPAPRGLVLPPAYRRRVVAAKARVDALGLRYEWIAEAVGCSAGWVSQVLGRHRVGGAVLGDIEALLGRAEAGAEELPPAAYRRGRKPAGLDVTG